MAGPPDAVLSGIPSVPGTYGFTVQVADSRGQVHEASFVMTIIPVILLLRTVAGPPGSPTQLANAQLGESYQTVLTAQGGFGSYSWLIEDGALPEGRTLPQPGTPSTRMTGVPAAQGKFTFTVTVYDLDNRTASQVFGLTVDGI